MQYGKNIVFKKIIEYQNSPDSDEVTIPLLDQLKGLIEHLESHFHIFVGCFCQENNILSQWRNYSAQGGGYSLGLKFNSQTKFSHYEDDLNRTSHVVLRKIIYNPAVQANYIKICLDYIINGCKEWLTSFTENGMDKPDDWFIIAANETVDLLFDIILSCKDDIFSEEKEWRIIEVTWDDIKTDLYKFRNSNNRLIPYLDTYIFEKIKAKPIFPIESITYGPILEKEMTESVIKLYLQNVNTIPGSSPVEININDIIINSAGFEIRP